jgi:hypothetical protein
MRLVDLENNAVNLLGTMQERTPEQVRHIIRTLLQIAPELKEEAPDAVIEQMAKRIETQLFISMDDATTVQLKFEEWLPSRRIDTEQFYYPRYRNWLGGRGFPPSVLGVLDKDTDKVVGLLQDPHKAGAWRRRGLVVGHVQSGKTANYTGVICKAADYGYRFIVVLTGMQEDLRSQTQERIEEGFIGVSTEAVRNGESAVGVGRANLKRRPMTLTSRDKDFSSTHVSLQVPLQSLSEPLVLVMKKNAHVLRNLVEWLKTKSSEGSGAKISAMPMLLIDDEADNASVNTSDPEAPGRINGRIRELLDLFSRNVYLGYTATPFANIFIDPDATDNLKREDLFPRDFIVSLDAPSNYVGASRIFATDGDLNNCLREIEDHSQILPERHKITLDPQTLPDSLADAVRTFLLARAVREMRGQGTAHSSMLVNVSRFNDVQTRITGLVADLLGSIREACLSHAGLPEIEALRDGQIAKLQDTWDREFSELSETWSDVQPLLPKAVARVEVRKINSKSADALDYRRYKDAGLHVIAIGGLALSRGFTLEGLTVSYFLRNSMMYDTLLQMGRWFGYRDGYQELCRIYMTPTAIGWYAHISEAIEELRFEFKRMERLRKTPEEFGLRVRSHPSALIVTARNKMRTGRPVPHSVALSGRSIETTYLKVEHQRENLAALNTFVGKLGEPTWFRPGSLLWQKVTVDQVRLFISSFRNHDDISIETQTAPVLEYISRHEQGALRTWDVCLYGLAKAGPAGEATINSLQIFKESRGGTYDEAGGYVKVSGTSARIAGPGDEKAGMSEEEIAAAEAEFSGGKGNNSKRIPDSAYRLYRSRPLLMLHLMQVTANKSEQKAFSFDDLVAWGMSLPGGSEDEQTVKYMVNTTWWRQNFEDAAEEEDGEAQGV